VGPLVPPKDLRHIPFPTFSLNAFNSHPTPPPAGGARNRGHPSRYFYSYIPGQNPMARGFFAFGPCSWSPQSVLAFFGNGPSPFNRRSKNDVHLSFRTCLQLHGDETFWPVLAPPLTFAGPFPFRFPPFAVSRANPTLKENARRGRKRPPFSTTPLAMKTREKPVTGARKPPLFIPISPHPFCWMCSQAGTSTRYSSALFFLQNFSGDSIPWHSSAKLMAPPVVPTLRLFF